MTYAIPSSLTLQALKFLLTAALLGTLLLAHGCHRHEDNELFTAWLG